MPYGLEKNDVDTTSYYSSFSGYSPLFGNSSVNRNRLSRSGENGVWTNDQVSRVLTKVIRWRTGVIGTKSIPYKVKELVATRTVRGRPITSPAGDVIGYTPDRVKKIFRTSIRYRTKYVYGKIPFVTYKTILHRVEGQPLYNPHRCLTIATTSNMGSQSSTVALSQYNAPMGNTIISGIMQGAHSGSYYSFGVDPGVAENNEQNSYFSQLSSESLYKMTSKCRDGIANLGELAAERHQTKKSVMSICGQIADLLLKGKRAFADAVERGVTNPAKFASTYLEAVYGLLPLVSDASDMIHELNSESRTWRKYSGSARKEWETVQSYATSSSYVTIVSTHSLVVKNQITFSGADSAQNFLVSHGLTNALSLGWEAMPWSFVVDWFIPIGQFISSQDMFAGVSVTDWHESSLYTRKTRITVTHKSGIGSIRGFEGATQTGETTYKYFNRAIKTGAPSSLPFPQFKNPLSLTHGANALVLAIQQLAK